MADRSRWVGLRIGVRLLLPRGRAERAGVLWLVVGSAVVMVAVALGLGLLQSISVRADVVAGRAPYFVPRGHDLPLARVQVLDIGGREAAIYELGPLPRAAAIDPPPGVPRWPRPGETYLSDGAADERATNPYLAALTPGRDVGRIGRSGLRDPADVVIVVGATEDELARKVGAGRVRGFGLGGQGGEVETSQEVSRNGIRTLWLVGLSTLLAGGAGLMIAVARVADTARRRRLAVLQLLGASLRTVRAIAMVHAVSWSSAGAVLGLALVWPLAQRLSSMGVFGITWWPDRSFNAAVVGWSMAGVAVVAAWGGWRSVARDGWGTRRRWAEPSLSATRWAPLLTGLVVLGGVLASQARRRHVDAATPPRIALLLLGAAALCCVGTAMVAPLVTRLIARRAGGLGTGARVAAARVDHHVRDTARWGLALVLLVLISGVVMGAVHSIAWQSSDRESDLRSVAIPAADDLGRRVHAAALGAVLQADGNRKMTVDRGAGTTEPFTAMTDRRRSDLGYVVTTRPEDVSAVAAEVQRAWPEAPPLIVDRNLAGQRGTALTSGTLLLCLSLVVAMALVALGVNLMSLQDSRRAADFSLLTLGMSGGRLSGVRSWEVLLGVLPGPLLASAIAVPLGLAAMHLDHTNVPVPASFALLPAATVVVVLGVAAAAGASAPRLRDGYRRAE